MDYKLFILNKLLDKYENSKSLIEKSNRRIKLNLKELREYDIENYELKRIFHDIVFDLHEKGFIDFSWKKHEKRKYFK